MYSVFNTLSEYTYFYISKNTTSYTFLLVFKIVEGLKCILKSFFYQLEPFLFQISFRDGSSSASFILNEQNEVIAIPKYIILAVEVEDKVRNVQVR